MISSIKKIVLSSKLLMTLANIVNKRILKRKLNVLSAKGSFIGFSVICEGSNFFDRNSTIINSQIGFASYLAANTNILKTKIGRYTSIGPNVNCVFGNHPTNTFVSTHPAFFSLRKQAGFTYVRTQKFADYAEPRDISKKYSILIGNDVWVGANATILDGVSIGDGAIIASNALVNKDVAPYSIVGGVPAKLIKKRFSDNEIRFLLDLKWWDKSSEWIANNSELFSNIKTFRKKFENE